VRHRSGRHLRAALEVRFEASLDVKAVHQDPMTAAFADQPDVRAEARHSEFPAAAGVGLAQGDPIADAEVDRCHR
jgi:hypothetical protein